MDNFVDGFDEVIKFYVIKLMWGSFDDSEGWCVMEIIFFVINFEYIGDIIDKSLSEFVIKKIKWCF